MPTAPAPRAYATHSRPLWQRLLLTRETAVIALLVAVVLYALANVDNFDGPLTLTYLLLDVTPILLIALPMTLVIVTGEIDLSVASVVGLSTVLVGSAVPTRALDPGRRPGRPRSPAPRAALSTASSSPTSASRRWPSPSAPWPSTAGWPSGCSGPTADHRLPRPLDRPRDRRARRVRRTAGHGARRPADRGLRRRSSTSPPSAAASTTSDSTPRPPASPGSTSRAPSSGLFVLSGVVSALAGVYFMLRFGSARGDNAAGLELAGDRGRAARRGLDLRRPRRAARRPRRRPPDRRALQRAPAGEHHGQHHQHHHRAAPRRLGDLPQRPDLGLGHDPLRQAKHPGPRPTPAPSGAGESEGKNR